MNRLIDDGDRFGKPFEVVVLVKSRRRTSQRIRQRRQISPENSLSSSNLAGVLFRIGQSRRL
ncbi:hypothetical protein F2Q68_00022561 [Brassica cretica]|uniref:Uncharacterized protein n=1 Tax=Brassica cretica TaxID=69181 RepID=A0A8S9FTP4_BRACR|nr:hypothetical protein F2Q68_00022561 [Brassica cretica]